MGRRRSNTRKDIFEIGTMLPWWVTMPLALAVYAALHALAQGNPITASDPRDALGTLAPNIGRAVAAYAQYVIPGLLLAGGLFSLLRHAKRSRLLASVLRKAAPDLDALTWREFEDLVHEMFRRQGYSVVQTEAGPDGGIDLKLKMGASVSTVQCKHWRSKKVDVRTVREQLGVMTASGADNCFVVTTGAYTDAAKKFARGQPITLIDRTSLREQLAKLGGNRSEMPSEINHAEPICPRCSSRMVRRTAKRGPNSGEQFWGCSSFPACRAVLS